MYNVVTRKFIDRVQLSLNRQVMVDQAVTSLIICGVGMIIVGLIFVVLGYQVELPYLLIPLVVALLYMIESYHRKRYDVEQAAAYADTHFELNDALVSALDFEGQAEIHGFHKLHFSATEALCKIPDLSNLRLKIPWYKLLVSCGVGIVALILAMQDSAPVIIAARQRQQQTIEMTKGLNQNLRNEFELLKKKLLPAEHKLLAQTKLEQLVRKLKPRGKFKDAMRQYAKLEQMLNKLSASQQLKSNRQLLHEIAWQLLKGRDSKKLGQQLGSGKYKAAAATLKQLKHAGDQQHNLEQLKQLLTKMTQAADQLSYNKSNLKAKLNALKAAVDKYSKAMQDAGKSLGRAAQENLSRENENAEEQLNKLSEALEQQQMSDEFIDKLMKMRSAMQQAQQQLRGMQKGTGAPTPNGMPGRGTGHKFNPGAGVSSTIAGNRRNGGDKTSASGQLTKITGQQGRGISQKTIANATSGSGVSRRVNRQIKAKFSYQMEAFIKRNDVPEAMKAGVKRYFSDLHEADR